MLHPKKKYSVVIHLVQAAMGNLTACTYKQPALVEMLHRLRECDAIDGRAHCVLCVGVVLSGLREGGDRFGGGREWNSARSDMTLSRPGLPGSLVGGSWLCAFPTDTNRDPVASCSSEELASPWGTDDETASVVPLPRLVGAAVGFTGLGCVEMA